MHFAVRRCCVPVALMVAIGVAGAFAQSQNQGKRFQLKQSPKIIHNVPGAAPPAPGSSSTQLPVWNYHVVSPRDGNSYTGVIVGSNPQARGSHATTTVAAKLVPIILQFQSVATAANLTTGIITTAPGHAMSNPTAPDNACLTGNNNVPLNLLAHSPIFNSADFNFGGTDVGTTQYTDAFQRAEFWTEINRNQYHTLLGPVQVLPALTVKVPAQYGLSLPANIFQPDFSMCGPEGIVDINFLDAYVTNQLKNLSGVNPGTFPMFMIYNTGMSFGDPTNLGNCCAGGYHSIYPGVVANTFQTYSPFDFDVSGFFVSSANDTAIASHEVAEWTNDPYVINATPPWGNTGQVVGCQANLEVGDPLTGSEAPRIHMPNGFTYHLQELAFYSWFFGGPSLGVNGWYSNNGTFLTDAGPPCS
ncbi:MAG TPA: hypothetical protein VGS27_14285 [Candidatus Sulfotelmatobacter sp.]|nr:hypothetical protein [Candidatus Sulfotelmatobacter sp.]